MCFFLFMNFWFIEKVSRFRWYIHIHSLFVSSVSLHPVQRKKNSTMNWSDKIAWLKRKLLGPAINFVMQCIVLEQLVLRMWKPFNGLWSQTIKISTLLISIDNRCELVNRLSSNNKKRNKNANSRKKVSFSFPKKNTPENERKPKKSF